MQIIEKFYMPHREREKQGGGINVCIKAIKENASNNTFAVIADFDRTLSGDLSTTWNALGDSHLFSVEYREQKERNYKKYRPYELGTGKLSEEDRLLSPQEIKNKYMEEWWESQLQALKKHGKNGKQKLDQIAQNSDLLQWRKGAKEFVEFLYQKEVPLIVISAGIECLIERFFHHQGVSHPLLSIESNIMQFNEAGDITGLNHDFVIHSANKSIICANEKTQNLLQGKTDFLILGDSKDDIDMASLEIVKKQAKNVLTVGLKTTEGTLQMFDETDFHIINTKEDFSHIHQLTDYILTHNI